jgi:CysZ protein
MNDLLNGFGYLREGLRLIRTPGLRRYVAIPLLISTLLFTTAIYAGYYWLEVLMNWLLGPLFALTVVLLVFYTFSLLTNLLAAPFNGLLAEAVEKYLTGQSLDEVGGWQAVLKDIVPSLFSELRKLLYFILRAIPLGILFLIPGINLAAPFLWALFSAWMLAVEYIDYPMGNHMLHFAEQRKRLRRRRLLSWGFGGGSLLMTLIPVVNFFAMPASVAGATAMWVREHRQAGDKPVQGNT